MSCNTTITKERPSQRISISRNIKNKQSQAFLFDAQRLHRIHLRTIQLLNQHFQNINGRASSQEPQNSRKPSKSNFQQLRDHLFSLSSDNQQLIAKQMKQMKLTYKDVFRSQQLKEMQQKLKRIKTTSSSLDKEIKLYEQHLVEELRDLNLEGNDWIQMKMNSKIKQEWRKRNLNEVHEYNRQENVNNFFHRKITTDFQAEKKKIISNIKKLRLQTNHYRQSKTQHDNRQQIFQIGNQFNQNEAFDYENRNKFVHRAWNLSKVRTSSLQADQQPNSRRSKIVQSYDESKRFLGQYEPLVGFVPQQKHIRPPKIRKMSDKLKIEKSKTDLKISRKWSENTKQNTPNDFGTQFTPSYHRSPFKSSFHGQKTRELNLRLQKDKADLLRSKPSKKLVL